MTEAKNRTSKPCGAKPDLLYMAGSGVRWFSHLENSSEICYKIKFSLALSPTSCIPDYLSQINENSCSHRNLHTSVSSICEPGARIEQFYSQ